MPGISPQVLGFADRVVALGCTAVLPDLFGTPGRDPLVAGLTERVAGLRTFVGACVSREFTVLATGRSSPITGWLRALAAREHERCGGPGGLRRGDVFLRRLRPGHGGRPGGGRTGAVPAVVAHSGEPVAQAHDRLRRSGPGRRCPALRPWPAGPRVALRRRPVGAGGAVRVLARAIGRRFHRGRAAPGGRSSERALTQTPLRVDPGSHRRARRADAGRARSGARPQTDRATDDRCARHCLSSQVRGGKRTFVATATLSRTAVVPATCP